MQFPCFSSSAKVVLSFHNSIWPFISFWMSLNILPKILLYSPFNAKIIWWSRHYTYISYNNCMLSNPNYKTTQHSEKKQYLTTYSHIMEVTDYSVIFYETSEQAFINYNLWNSSFHACMKNHRCMFVDVGNCARKRADVHITNNNIMWW